MGIGPSTKETTLHHFRDPLLDVVSNDEDIDLLGIIVVGTPQDNEDGAILSCDGWGNSHVDFANTVEQVATRGIPVVGLTFVGTVAQFVVVNEYMDTIVDMNKNPEGIESEIVGENEVTELEARKALAFLKLKTRKYGK